MGQFGLYPVEVFWGEAAGYAARGRRIRGASAVPSEPCTSAARTRVSRAPSLPASRWRLPRIAPRPEGQRLREVHLHAAGACDARHPAGLGTMSGSVAAALRHEIRCGTKHDDVQHLAIGNLQDVPEWPVGDDLEATRMGTSSTATCGGGVGLANSPSNRSWRPCTGNVVVMMIIIIIIIILIMK